MCRTTGLVPSGPPGTPDKDDDDNGAEVGIIGFGGLRVVLLVGRVAAESAGEVERGVGGAVGIGVLVGSAIGVADIILSFASLLHCDIFFRLLLFVLQSSGDGYENWVRCGCE